MSSDFLRRRPSLLVDRLRTYDWRRRLPAAGLVCFIIVLALQVPYPLLDTSGQRFVSIWSVVAFFSASCVHAWWSRGPRAVGALALVGVGGGLGVEAVGSRTGLPFGNYGYTQVLGWQILGVPIVVALAWAMFGWLALLAAQHVGGRRRGVLLGAAVLVAWDLFLDPQMVRAGAWVWRETAGPSLHEIPVLNSLGWFIVGLGMVALLLRLVPPARVERPDDLGWLLLGWTIFSETLLFAVFFEQPSVAVIGTPAFAAVLWLVWYLGRAARR